MGGPSSSGKISNSGSNASKTVAVEAKVVPQKETVVVKPEKEVKNSNFAPVKVGQVIKISSVVGTGNHEVTLANGNKFERTAQTLVKSLSTFDENTGESVSAYKAEDGHIYGVLNKPVGGIYQATSVKVLK